MHLPNITKMVWARLRYGMRKHGFRGLCLQVAERAYKAVFRDAEILFAVDALDISRREITSSGQIAVERFDRLDQISPDQMEKLAKQKGGIELLVAELESFFTRGGVFWLIRCDGEPAGYHWSVRAGLHNFCFFPMTERDAVLMSSEIFPEFRGRGLNPAMIQHVLQELTNEGITRMYISCKIWNHANQRSIPKTSFRKIGTARVFRLFGRRLVFWSQVNVTQAGY
jgi:GNAT superfamily N-acetyltransferase